jgi:hypothetical protein
MFLSRSALCLSTGCWRQGSSVVLLLSLSWRYRKCSLKLDIFSKTVQPLVSYQHAIADVYSATALAVPPVKSIRTGWHPSKSTAGAEDGGPSVAAGASTGSTWRRATKVEAEVSIPANTASIQSGWKRATTTSTTPAKNAGGEVDPAKRPFLRIVADWATNEEDDKGPAAVLPSVCKQLLLLYIAVFPRLFVRSEEEQSWTRHKATTMLVSKNPAIKEFGLKVLTEILKLRKTPQLAVTLPSDGILVLSSVEIAQYLSSAIIDSESKVKNQALVAVGELSEADWALLCHTMTDGGHRIYTIGLLNELMNCTTEQLGLVRTGACRVLGQVLNNGVINALCRAQNRIQPLAPFDLPKPSPKQANTSTTTTVPKVEVSVATSGDNNNNYSSSSSPREAPVLLSPTDLRAGSANSPKGSNNHKSPAINLFDQYFLTLIINCVKDTKLSVRLQGSYALGCCLLRLLPFRLQYLAIKQQQPQSPQSAPNGSASSGDGSDTVFTGIVDDGTWLKLASLSINQLDDSDKVLASASRCLGLLAAGLLPGVPAHGHVLAEILTALLRKFIHGKRGHKDKMKGRADGAAAEIADAVHDSREKVSAVDNTKDDTKDDTKEFFNEHNFEMDLIMKSIITDLPKKVIFSLNLAFGLISRVYFTHCMAAATASMTTTSSGMTGLDKIEDVKIVFAAMFRYGVTSKIKLQACKGLIFLYFAEAAASSSNSEWTHRVFVRILENLMLLVTAFAKGKGTSKARLITPSVTLDQQQRPILSDGDHRANSLQRAVLVLSWILLKHINIVADGKGSHQYITV